MKDVIQGLIKNYFNIRMILKRTILTERKGRITINVYDDVAPNLWNMYEQGTINLNTGTGKLDFNRVYAVQEDERLRIAKQVLEMSLIILKDQSNDKIDKKKEWDNKYGKIAPMANSNHVDMITYCLGALFHLGILTPFEFDIMEPAFDEGGHLLYIKNIPKPRTDEATEALGHLAQEEQQK